MMEKTRLSGTGTAINGRNMFFCWIYFASTVISLARTLAQLPTTRWFLTSGTVPPNLGLLREFSGFFISRGSIL
ncbi:hypothetical protein FB451DRAFT_1245354 [Mycena latifolia]|nr:hypothetical protein FB451DRAFT_1245354 [Mycena latifolia]